MDAQIADWLTRFAAGAGTLYEWQVNNDGVLRAHVGDIAMCPVSAQLTLETGHVYGDTQGPAAAGYFGLFRHARQVVLNAADDLLSDVPQVSEIRAHLLRICRVAPEEHGG